MTVAAVIFYKDGVLLVSDSRGVMLERPQFASSANSKVTYFDDKVKSLSSTSGDVAAVALGDEDIATRMLNELLENETLLTSGSDGGLAAATLRIQVLVADSNLAGEGGVLAAIRGADGAPRAVEVCAASGSGKKEPAVAIREITKNTARGFDTSVQKYLDTMVGRHCPDKANMGLAEAVAIGFMLEERFMRHHLEIVPGKRAVMAGGPMRMHIACNDPASHGYGIVVDVDETRALQGKQFKELRDYFADRIEHGNALRLLRKERADKSTEQKSAA